MAVAFDNQVAAQATINHGSAQTFTNFVVTASNPIIFVGLVAATASGVDNVSGVTFNNVGMTRLARLDVNGANNTFFYLYALAGNGGTHDVAVSIGGSVNVSVYTCVMSYSGAYQAAVYSGGGQTDAVATKGSVTATSISNAITTITDNSRVATWGYDDNGGNNPQAGTNVTQRATTAGSLRSGDNNADVHPAGSLSQSWTSAGSDPLAMMQVTISPAIASDNPSVTDSTAVSDTAIVNISLPVSVTDSSAVSDTPQFFIPKYTIIITDTTAVTATPSFVETTPGTSPLITFHSSISPYSTISALSYVQSMLGGNNLPVLQGEVSNTVIFRVYNNFALAAAIASAVNIRITVYDGASVASHLATKSVVNQEWIRVYENGYGENSSPPGLYTRYLGQDTAVGGTANEYVPEFGSDGTTNPRIRAGSNMNGTGFIEIASYAELPDSVGTLTNTFAVSVLYDWSS